MWGIVIVTAGLLSWVGILRLGMGVRVVLELGVRVWGYGGCGGVGVCRLFGVVFVERDDVGVVSCTCTYCTTCVLLRRCSGYGPIIRCHGATGPMADLCVDE